MAKPITIRRLPRNPKDGDVVADKYGNLWEFSSDKNTWIDRGTINEPPDVSETQSGLVTPTVFKKLRHLRSLYESSPDLFQTLKLAPGTLAYWYYFRSADKLFKFTPEGESGLRIEIDRGRLFQILRKQVCSGAPGPRGDQGDQGEPGDSGATEGCWVPSAVEGDRLDFAIFVPTPIKTPISLRLHRASPTAGPMLPQRLGGTDDHFTWWSAYLKKTGFTNPLGVVEKQYQSLRTVRAAQAEGLVKQAASACNIELSAPLQGDADQSPSLELTIDPSDVRKVTFTQPVEALMLDQSRTGSSLQYDPLTRVLCGSLYLASGSWGSPADWCVKARQVGPDGPDGPDGKCAVSIVECAIADSPLLATCPIISLRADCEDEVLYWLCSELLPERCVDRLQLAPGAAGIGQDDALLATFGAAQVTTEQCKKIYRYKVELPQDEIPTLDLAHWDPQPGCVSKRNFDRHKFDWIPTTDLPACNTDGIRWFDATDLLPTKFPWSPIVEQPPEKDECCADDMFYCPNAQDDACPPIPDPIIIPPAGGGGDGGGGGGGDNPPPPPPTGPPAPPPTGPPAPPPPSSTCITLTLLGDNDQIAGAVTLTKTSENWNYTSVTRLSGGAWRGCQMLSAKGSATSVQGGNVPPPAATCCVTVPVTFELGGNGSSWSLIMSCPVVPVLPPEVPTPDKNSAMQTGTWDCTSYKPPTYAESPTGRPYIGLVQMSTQVAFNLDNPASLVGTVFTLPTSGLGGNLGVTYKKVKVVDCTPAPPPPPTPPGPPPPPADPTCIKLNIRSWEGSGASPLVTTTVTMSKVANHYDYGLPGMQDGACWRGQVMQQAWGSLTCSSPKPVPPSPPNMTIPVVYELMLSAPQNGKRYFYLLMNFPICTNGQRNVATSSRQQSGQGTGNWDLSNFIGTGFPRANWINNLVHVQSGEMTQADITNPIGKTLTNVSSAQLFNGSGTIAIVACDGSGGPPPPPPPSGPPAPPPAATCCIGSGNYILQADRFGPAMAMTKIGDSLKAGRTLGRSSPGCQVPLVNMAVQYFMNCADSTHVHFMRSYACCGESVAVQEITIPFTTGDLVFPLPAASSGRCSLAAEVVVVKGSCTPTGPPAPPPSGPPPPPSGPPAPPPPPGGCTDGKQSCGEILFTGVNNTGQNKANTVIIRDPLGDTRLQLLTMNGRTVWRGCSMRTVPQAWVGCTATGFGGTLTNNVRVPVAYDLYCYPYPGNYGRPTPSPATSYPTDGFWLRMFWPVRKQGEVIPCSGRVVPTVIFNCSTCIPNGPCTPGSIQNDWYYPQYSAQLDQKAQVCSPRPLSVGFQMQDVTPIFGVASQLVTLLEQDYTGPPVGGGGGGGGLITHRLPDDWEIPIVRI